MHKITMLGTGLDRRRNTENLVFANKISDAGRDNQCFECRDATAANSGNQELEARIARATLDSSQVNLRPFRASDFDLANLDEHAIANQCIFGEIPTQWRSLFGIAPVEG